MRKEKKQQVEVMEMAIKVHKRMKPAIGKRICLCCGFLFTPLAPCSTDFCNSKKCRKVRDETSKKKEFKFLFNQDRW